MSRLLSSLVTICLGLMALGATPASAQATRTWVSGVGDDANPCSRTAPCKTFAGAISKTAAAGEINCLDPGGFGGVTITKSLMIICDGFQGGILISGTNGVVVNAATTDTIILSGLNIDGLGTSLGGVKVIQAGVVQVRNTSIRGFNKGIDFEPTNAAQLVVTDSVIHDNTTGTSPGGIVIQPALGGAANVHLSRVRVVNNAIGIVANGGNTASGVNINIQDSLVAGNTAVGVAAFTNPGASPAAISILNSQISGNFGPGLQANGTAAGGAGGAVVRVGGSLISGNAIGIQPIGGGQVRSFGDNKVGGNSSGETFSGNDALK